MSLLFNKPLIYMPAQKKVESAPAPTELNPNALSIFPESIIQSDINSVHTRGYRLRHLRTSMTRNPALDGYTTQQSVQTGKGYNDIAISTTMAHYLISIYPITPSPSGVPSFVESANRFRMFDMKQYFPGNSSPSGVDYIVGWFCDPVGSSNNTVYELKYRNAYLNISTETYNLPDSTTSGSARLYWYFHKFKSTALTKFGVIQNKLEALNLLSSTTSTSNKYILLSSGAVPDILKVVNSFTTTDPFSTLDTIYLD